MTIRAIVVDDEPLGREGIVRLSEEIPDLEILAECGNGREALDRIRALSPDLVFLDIEMPELGGFELLAEIEPELVPEVVFVTAYDEYAVRAFEIHAVDYLMKPINPGDFERAVGRVRARLATPSVARADVRHETLSLLRAPSSASPPAAFVRRLLVRDRERAFFVPTDDVLWLSAAANYVRLATAGGRQFLIRGTLGEIESQLDPRRFLRVHRSTIVNLDHVQEVRRDEMHRYSAVTADGRGHRVSRGARKALLGHH